MLKDALNERCIKMSFTHQVEPSSSEYSAFLETSNGVVHWASVILLRDYMIGRNNITDLNLSGG